MTPSVAIKTAFAKENFVLLEQTIVGRVIITKKTSKDYFGGERTTYNAQSLEAGIQASCKAPEPMSALLGLCGQLRGRN